jgi:hypothetical protein
MYLEHLQLKSQPFAEHAAVAALWTYKFVDTKRLRTVSKVCSGNRW